MRYSYSTEICCAKQIEFDVENGVVKNIVFYGGCDGNLKMISKLLEGWTLDQIIDKCSGNLCRNKGTSCADQLAKACASVKASIAG
ncbi:MAG: TIGR03905 family TSCPD domain-containing protein [Succinivibrionaceae bacterium]|jgi:uncharacterized protein (TIGR03905 family)|nr:TIGR03905 family TSCPD domain-containing protein [Succinivibrionaceae bacterium]